MDIYLFKVWTITCEFRCADFVQVFNCSAGSGMIVLLSGIIVLILHRSMQSRYVLVTLIAKII